ncbi:MAG: ABC transporter ATP-binding protein [Flavobacteriales bacterium]|nr:ABC transporter ATP-binding protein [Flavobacteriales bacterium]
MLETKGLQFQYPNGPSFSFPDIKCDAGEALLLLGQSGKGKTTLLHVIAGLMAPTQGDVLVDGQSVYEKQGSELDQFRGKNIGIIYQTAHFVKSLNVEENLALPQFLVGNKIDKKKAEDTLDRLQIKHHMRKSPKRLSVGEQQRVAIARSLMNSPKVILADEPTSALDDENASEVIQLLKDQAKLENAALIVVTHDQRLKDQIEKRIEL